MNLRKKIVALAMCSIAVLSFTGCSQKLKYQDKDNITRTIKITDGRKLYDQNNVIDGFEDGCATGTWVKIAGTQYFDAKTTDAHTLTNNMLKFTCTATCKPTAVAPKSQIVNKTVEGIVNYKGNGSSISRINISGIDYR